LGVGAAAAAFGRGAAAIERRLRHARIDVERPCVEAHEPAVPGLRAIQLETGSAAAGEKGAGCDASCDVGRETTIHGSNMTGKKSRSLPPSRPASAWPGNVPIVCPAT